jgi:SAM-dependent methyltransferase
MSLGQNDRVTNGSQNEAPDLIDEVHVARRGSPADETSLANRRWWDSVSDEYQAEHGAFLGDVRYVWGPEGLDEAEARLLGEVSGRRVLEIGCGAGQCGRWLVSQGAHTVGFDLSIRQLDHAARINQRTGVALPLVNADAQRLPFASRTFDVACSSYGALPFIADLPAVMSEVTRVLRPGGRLVFSVSHPVRWCFLDDPGKEGLYAIHSYFDRRAYVEEDEQGRATYAEHHRTVGDWVRAIRDAGLSLVDLVEPEWPDDNEQIWGGWSRLRGRILPGTAIFVCVKPRSSE